VVSALVVHAQVDTDQYAELLSKYVQPEGVAYEAWFQNTQDVEALDSVLDAWANTDVAALSPDDRKAFYINLYNAGMLQAVFRHYPLESVKDVGLIPFSIFKRDFIHLGDQEMSLDDIEKGTLFKEFPDPRVHFAVNCASESCPPLLAEPYVGAKLDAQLDQQTRLFAESDRAARPSRKQRTAYSELFKWYNDHFPGEHPADYLNQYRSEPLPTDEKFNWISYDWALNAAQ
jgi:hypothetical protein